MEHALAGRMPIMSSVSKFQYLNLPIIKSQLDDIVKCLLKNVGFEFLNISFEENITFTNRNVLTMLYE